MSFADRVKSDIVHSFSGFAHLVFHIWLFLVLSRYRFWNAQSRKWLSTNFHAHIMTIFKGLITSTRSHDNDIIPRDRPSMELIITVDLLCWTYHFHATSRIADFLKKWSISEKRNSKGPKFEWRWIIIRSKFSKK